MLFFLEERQGLSIVLKETTYRRKDKPLLKTKAPNQKTVRNRSQARAGMTLVEVMMALVITGLTVGGIVDGYIYCMTATTKDALYMAANARALERMEDARAAVWNTQSYPVVDQLNTTNFPDLVVNLNKSGPDPAVITATVKTTITQISTNPPLREIHVDCIWNFQGTEVVTNSIETCRAPN
jgi:prepilin-type N-terminal cleavage/methylation domain-containing protein